jgi:hypothetical protein
METRTLNLDTGYTTTGNSTGCAIDTLGIAFGFGDSNDINEMNIDYVFESLDYRKQEWLSDECEAHFKKTLTAEKLDEYINDLAKYKNDLADYEETFENVTSCEYDDSEAQKALASYLEKCEGEIYDELYNLWLHGDYRERGLLDKANKHFSDWKIEIDDAKQGNVSATISDDTMQLLLDDDQCIETKDDIFSWIEQEINCMARRVYEKERAEHEKRRAEHERVTKYQAEQKIKDEQRKIEQLEVLKNELIA